MFKDLMKKKSDKEQDPKAKHAKMQVLKHIADMASDSMGDDLKGMKKVSVAADDRPGLEAGLDRAKKLVHNTEDPDDEGSDVESRLGLSEGGNVGAKDPQVVSQGYPIGTEHPDDRIPTPEGDGKDGSVYHDESTAEFSRPGNHGGQTYQYQKAAGMQHAKGGFIAKDSDQVDGYEGHEGSLNTYQKGWAEQPTNYADGGEADDESDDDGVPAGDAESMLQHQIDHEAGEGDLTSEEIDQLIQDLQDQKAKLGK